MKWSFFHTKSMVILIGLLILSVSPCHAQSRSASFVNPNTVVPKSVDGKSMPLSNTVVADPATIDAGETLVNVARRITVFFYNGFRSPVQINDLTLNADGNVRSKVITDDCKGIKTLPVQDKCSVALEITPSSPGPWSVELLLNHSGMGRITRAEVNGTTLGKADEKAEGLAISKKIAATLDFGNVVAAEEKAARTMLIENDSTTPLLISSIDLITSDSEGLSIRKTGCKEGDELKPGESCPITVIWEPAFRGNIATDLIVRHSGNLGFVVVPIRGAGTLSAEAKDDGATDPKTGKPAKSRASLMPRGSGDSGAHASMPALDSLPLPKQGMKNDGSAPVQTATLKPLKSGDITPPQAGSSKPSSRQDADDDQQGGDEHASITKAPKQIPEIVLMGTVGGRAILGDRQEQTYMVGLGEKVLVGGSDVELLQLDPTRAVVMVAGERISLTLRNLQTIAHKTVERNDEDSGAGGAAASGALKNSKKLTATKPKEQVERHDPLDGSTTATPANSPVSLPATPGGGGLNSTGLSGDAGAGKQIGNTLTAQDVLNLAR